MRLTLQLCLWGSLFGSVNAWTTTPIPTVPNPAGKFQRNKQSALDYVNDKNLDISTTRVGEVLLGGKYMLTGYIPVPSLKCDIYKAYPLNPQGQIQGDQPLIVKFSNSNLDLEYVNYQRLWACLTPEQENLFVKIHDRIPGNALPVNEWGQPPPASSNIGDVSPESHHPPGIVMERGYDNLRVFVRKYGAYKGDALRQAFYSVISAVHALHSNNLIWTELKPENFVVTPKGIKAIDLESIVPTNELLQVYTAEACPPEFPLEEMYKTLPEMAVTEAFDVWGLGLVLFEMATGHSFYAEGMMDLEFIKRQLRNVDRTLLQARAKLRGHPNSIDSQAASIIMACLHPDPRERPSCQQLLASTYFSAMTDGSTTATTTNHPSDSKQSPSTHFFQAKNTAPRTAAGRRSSIAQDGRSIGEPDSFVTPLRATAVPKQQSPVVAQRYSDIAAKEQLVQKVAHRTTTVKEASKCSNASVNDRKALETITVDAKVVTTVIPPQKPNTNAVMASTQPSSTTTKHQQPCPTKKEGVSAAVHAITSESPKRQKTVSSGASSTTVSKEEQRRLDWKNQLTLVLDTLAVHAKEDPEMAYDLVSILDQAKEKVLPMPTPSLGY